MSAKKKSTPKSAEPVAEPVVPTPETKPVSLDDQARHLNEKIDDAESSSAGLLWELGGVLEGIRAQHPELKWGDFLKYADGLGSNKSRVTRALRIHHKFNSKALVERLSIYEALGYDRHPLEPEPEEPEREYEEENAPLTSREYHAGKRFIKAIGGNLEPAARRRAAVVLGCIERGDKPVKKASDKSWVQAWEEIKRDRNNLRTRMGEGDLYRAFTSLYKDTDIPSYMDVKADYVEALKRFREIRANCYELAQKRRAEQAAGFGKVVVSLKEISDMLVTDPAKPETAEAVPVAKSGKDDSNGQLA